MVHNHPSVYFMEVNIIYSVFVVKINRRVLSKKRDFFFLFLNYLHKAFQPASAAWLSL